MAKDHEISRSEHSASKSVAHNNRSAGISLPAVVPFQLVKIPFYSHDGTQLDTDEPMEVNNHVTALLSTGNIKEVERLAAYLAKLNDGASGYGELSKGQYLAQGIKGTLLMHKHNQRTKERPKEAAKEQSKEPVKELPKEQPREPSMEAPKDQSGEPSMEALKEPVKPVSKPPAEAGPVLEAFRRRNVVIAGETHGMAGIGDKEKRVWGKYNIAVKYENESIVDKEKGPVTPDPGALRILYFMEQFYEAILMYKASNSKESNAQNISLMDTAYNQCIKEHGDYTALQIKNGLIYKGKSLMSYDRLVAYKRFMYDIMELIEKTEKEKFLSLPQIRGQVDEVLGVMEKIKESKGKEDGGVIMREIRSDAMFESLEKDLNTAEKTIYKVGNNHILDVSARIALEKLGWVFTQDQYLAELDRQDALQD